MNKGFCKNCPNGSKRIYFYQTDLGYCGVTNFDMAKGCYFLIDKFNSKGNILELLRTYNSSKSPISEVINEIGELMEIKNCPYEFERKILSK